MKIFKVRYGFATNSSSTHSVILEGGKFLSDEEMKEFKKSNKVETGLHAMKDLDFGWDEFVLKTPDEKLSYYAIQLENNITRHNNLNSNFARSIINDLLKINISEKALAKGVVDHQSAWNFPTNAPYKFYVELKDFLLNPNVTIYGGNDNSDSSFEFNEEDINFQQYLDSYFDYIVKEDGDYWICFSPANGNKFRFSFKDTVENYTKSKTPELVDLKITNYCRSHCNWCYMNSGSYHHFMHPDIKDKHADYKDIASYIYSLRDLGVFEIALGGGEPTTHPSFKDILGCIKGCNMIPNFSTYSIDWLRDFELVKLVMETVGGIGVSVHNVEDIHYKYDPIKYTFSMMGSYTKNLNIQRTRSDNVNISGQHVFGSLSYDETVNLIQECSKVHMNLLLLGPKFIGRGTQQNLNIFEGRFDDLTHLLESYGGRLSVDTSFANIYTKVLEKLECNRCTYETEEGKFSCFIDAVENKIGPCSYQPCSLLDLNDIFTTDGGWKLTDLIKDLYAKF